MRAAQRRRILFLCHSASRNGATILLLHLVQWLKSHSDWEMEVLINGNGPLVPAFQEVARTTVLRGSHSLTKVLSSPSGNAIRAVLDRCLISTLLHGRSFDLIYANTAATSPQLAALRRRGRVLWHIHEMGYALRLILDRIPVSPLLDTVTRFVAVSHSVEQVLTEELSVHPDRIDMVHGFVPMPDLAQLRATRQRTRRELGWPEDAFVVGGCGAPGWRKGTDLFVQVANRLLRGPAGERMRFLWVGGAPRDREFLEYAHDVAKLGLGNRCRIIPTTPDVTAYYCAMDAFALTSREDPFPLVALEAAAHGIPTICFASAGGAPEFTSGGAGIAVPYLDTEQFALALSALHATPLRRESMGQHAQMKVRERHSIETQGPKLLNCIERCL